MYHGRLAPTPSGLLHLGHARTFWTAQQRAREHRGELLYRNEDLDPDRCRPEFTLAALEDMEWLGLKWNGTPINQSARRAQYHSARDQLRAGGHLFPCDCSRKDILEATIAPHAEDGETIYPGTCRAQEPKTKNPALNWRFRIPDGEPIEFIDAHLGPQRFVAGRDFGDFPVWQKNDLPAYQLAVVVDDNAMKITEVVRGADLLLSTARQLLLYRALSLQPPSFYHCPLVTDENGKRLAKRDSSQSLRALRETGMSPEEVRHRFSA